jgi:hypothetical protein
MKVKCNEIRYEKASLQQNINAAIKETGSYNSELLTTNLV